VTVISPALLFATALFAAGCAGPAGTRADAPDIITVEGRVTYYGAAPFAAAMLVTDDGNWYVLNLTDDQESELVTPSRQRIRGRVYLDDWQGRPLAHLRVETVERVMR
jgi:hypothetical protein